LTAESITANEYTHDETLAQAAARLARGNQHPHAH
jgi:hypothetical protein